MYLSIYEPRRLNKQLLVLAFKFFLIYININEET